MKKNLKQIADEIGVSKQAVYKKIHKEPLATNIKDYIETVNGTVYILEKGQTIIKRAFTKKIVKQVTDNITQTVSSEVYGLLKENFEVLQNQLEVKDKQIADLKKLLDQEQQLNLVHQQNFLMLSEQPKERKNHTLFKLWEKKKEKE